MSMNLRPPLIVGITGGIGSGKTTVANLFAARGVPLVDTDVVAHQLTGPGGAAMPAIEREFGRAVIEADGRLNRGAMRQLAFDDAQARKRLEAIMHPMIRQATLDGLAAVAHHPYALLVVPLLVESRNWHERCDRVLVVDCPPEVQIERVIRRSHLLREQVESILRAQATREQRLAAADDLVDNGGGPEGLEARVDALHAQYQRLAAERAPVRH